MDKKLDNKTVILLSIRTSLSIISSCLVALTFFVITNLSINKSMSFR